MDIVKFTVGGKFAFFKKPDVNSYIYFTYGNIHKIALIGMLGAIMGYSGYNNMSYDMKYNKNKVDFPEFYERLNQLKVSIIPNKVSISKKIQVFNNSIGYASSEQGGNLIIKEQWLENPSWDIYLMIDCEESQKISVALQNNQCVYIPYLGKNDHMANITDVNVIQNAERLATDEINSIDSMFIKDDFTISNQSKRNILMYKYDEYLPYSLELETNKYDYKRFLYTNAFVKCLSVPLVYRVENKNIAFF